MKSYIIHHIAYIFIALGCIACRPTPYTPKKGLPQEFTIAYEEIYGHCYDSVPLAVVALDLYSEGLELDSTHRMQGTGYNLYISDIFVPDLHLEKGEYRSIPQDSLSTINYQLSTFTFLPGKDYEGTPNGIYVLYVEEGKLQTIQVLDSGRFVVRDTTNGLTDIQFTLYYTNAERRVSTYEAHFQGALIPWEKR